MFVNNLASESYSVAEYLRDNSHKHFRLRSMLYQILVGSISEVFTYLQLSCMYKTHEKECLKFAVETGVICTHIYIYEICVIQTVLLWTCIFIYVTHTQIYTHKYIYTHLYLLHTFHIKYIFLEALYVPQLQQTRG